MSVRGATWAVSAAVALVAAAAVMSTHVPVISAQTRPPATDLPAKAGDKTAAWHDCGSTTAPLPSEAMAEATTALARTWLASERGYFAAYTMPGEVRNPFDLSPKQPDSGPRDGVVQARAPACAWQVKDLPGVIHVRFITPFYRFFEAGHGWSPPLRNGLMLEARIERAGDVWQAHDASGERGILLPDQKPRAANAAAIPADAPWAEPMPGCARKTRWNGEACVARKR